jgi:hypothetical protein
VNSTILSIEQIVVRKAFPAHDNNTRCVDEDTYPLIHFSSPDLYVNVNTVEQENFFSTLLFKKFPDIESPFSNGFISKKNKITITILLIIRK